MPVPRETAEKRPQEVAPPRKGERVVFIGNGLAERDVYFSRIETELQLRWPDRELVVRNMARVGDTPGFRPHPSRQSQWAFPGAEKFHPDKKTHNGRGFFPMPDEWLTHLRADTVVAFFGYNESFDGPAGVANFEAELDAFAGHTLSRAYNGRKAPRLVLVSPIAFENLSAKRDLPDGAVQNANLSLYAAAMERVARKRGLTYLDVFSPTAALYSNGGEAFTSDGFMPTEAGYQKLAVWLADGLFGKKEWDTKPDPKTVHAAVKQKDWFWQNDYHILNGVHTHGQRYNPFGPQNYPDEVKKTREMMVLRDGLIHAVANGRKQDLAVDDSGTHKLPPVPSNYKPGGKNGQAEYKYGEDALKSFTVPEGYRIELFASEREFPNLANPMQLSFDNRGRSHAERQDSDLRGYQWRRQGRQGDRLRRESAHAHRDRVCSRGCLRGAGTESRAAARYRRRRPGRPHGNHPRRIRHARHAPCDQCLRSRSLGGLHDVRGSLSAFQCGDGLRTGALRGRRLLPLQPAARHAGTDRADGDSESMGRGF
jgi:hypothetical protein